jgi:S-adenosyl methyltransferase
MTDAARAFDSAVPNVARMYDFMLGGKDNHASDRDAYLILSHATMDGAPPQEMARLSDAKAVYDRATAPLIMRDAAQVTRFLDGFSLVEPGLVHVSAWRPEGPARRGFDAFLGAVGRKD